MSTRVMVFSLVLVSGLVAERDPRLVRTAPVPKMSEAGRATLAGFAAVNRPLGPALPWSFFEEFAAGTERARMAAAGAVARVESRALMDALAVHNNRLDNVLSGLGVMLGELAKMQNDDRPAPVRAAAEAEHYPDGYELPDRQVRSTEDGE